MPKFVIQNAKIFMAFSKNFYNITPKNDQTFNAEFHHTNLALKISKCTIKTLKLPIFVAKKVAFKMSKPTFW